MKGNYDKAEDLLEKCTAYKTFTFPETIFTAVTAYQNQLVSNWNFSYIIQKAN